MFIIGVRDLSFEVNLYLLSMPIFVVTNSVFKQVHII